MYCWLPSMEGSGRSTLLQRSCMVVRLTLLMHVENQSDGMLNSSYSEQSMVHLLEDTTTVIHPTKKENKDERPSKAR